MYEGNLPPGDPTLGRCSILSNGLHISERQATKSVKDCLNLALKEAAGLASDCAIEREGHMEPLTRCSHNQQGVLGIHCVHPSGQWLY